MSWIWVAAAALAATFDVTASRAACRAGVPCARETELVIVCSEGSLCRYDQASAARACRNFDGRLPTLKELALAMAQAYDARGLTLAPVAGEDFELFTYDAPGDRRDGFFYSPAGFARETPAQRFWSGSTEASDPRRAWAFDTGSGAPSLIPRAETARLACVRPIDQGAGT